MVRRRTRQVRIYRGNIPANGTLIADNGEWALYRMESRQGFLNIKVVSLAPRPLKANFWLGWNLEKRVLVKKHDAKQLAHYPLLHDWIVCRLLEMA